MNYNTKQLGHLKLRCPASCTSWGFCCNGPQAPKVLPNTYHHYHQLRTTQSIIPKLIKPKPLASMDGKIWRQFSINGKSYNHGFRTSREIEVWMGKWCIGREWLNDASVNWVIGLRLIWGFVFGKIENPYFGFLIFLVKWLICQGNQILALIPKRFHLMENAEYGREV